jgi:hypothetical protein
MRVSKGQVHRRPSDVIARDRRLVRRRHGDPIGCLQPRRGEGFDGGRLPDDRELNQWSSRAHPSASVQPPCRVRHSPKAFIESSATSSIRGAVRMTCK